MGVSLEHKKFVEELLQKPLIARIATSSKNGQPHVVPVWYGWDGESLWVSSYSNTRKIKDIKKNPKVSISIDVTGKKNKTKAVILEGEVSLVKEPLDFLRKQFTWIFKKYLGEEGVLEKSSQELINDPRNLLIRLKPNKVFTWKW